MDFIGRMIIWGWFGYKCPEQHWSRQDQPGNGRRYRWPLQLNVYLWPGDPGSTRKRQEIQMTIAVKRLSLTRRLVRREAWPLCGINECNCCRCLGLINWLWPRTWKERFTAYHPTKPNEAIPHWWIWMTQLPWGHCLVSSHIKNGFVVSIHTRPAKKINTFYIWVIIGLAYDLKFIRHLTVI